MSRGGRRSRRPNAVLRSAWLLAALGSLLAGCASTAAGDDSLGEARATPCPTPYAAGDVLAAIPNNGGTRTVALRIGQYVVVGFSNCGEAGTLSTAGLGVVLRVTDAGYTNYGGPETDLRVLAETAGTATISGRGNRGARGSLIIKVSG